MERKQLAACLISEYAAASCFCFVAAAGMSGSTGSYAGFFPLALLLYAPAVFLLFLGFLRKERSVLSICLLGALFFLAMSFLLLRYMSFDLMAGRTVLPEAEVNGTGLLKRLFPGFYDLGCDPGLLAYVLLFTLILTCMSERDAIKPAALRRQIVQLDITVIVLLLYVVVLSLLGGPLIAALPQCLAAVLLVLSIRMHRSSRPLGARDLLFLGASFAGIAVLVVLFTRYLAGPASAGIAALWDAFVSCLKFLLGLVWRLLVFLASLFPEHEEMPYEPEFGIMKLPEREQEEPAGDATVAIIILAVLAFWGLFMLLRYLYRLKLGGKKKARTRSVYAKRNRIPFFQGLFRLFASLKRRFLLWRLLREQRDTAPGLFFWIVRKFRLSPLRKKAGETPRAFLSRLGLALGGEPASLLDGLADAAEKEMYAPSGMSASFPAYPEAPRIRSAVRRESRLYLAKGLLRRIQNRASVC